MMHIDKKILFFLLVFISLCIVNCLIHEKSKKKLSGLLQKTLSEIILVLVISTGIFFFIPHFFFDDAGFILRYLDHFREGYFFRFNIKDAPVYGISGFLHGIFTGILCWLHITTPEQALGVSNFMGFMASAYFLWLIIKKWVQPYWLVLPLWLLVLGSSKQFLSVASCGLETPLHMAFILSSVYFLIAQKHRLFFLMSALSIVSKLDAVPVVGILFFFYLIMNFKEIKTCFKAKMFQFILFFIVPLGISLLGIYLIFGSLLPQSAYSKLYHHSHPSDHWFPFLQYFTDTVLQRILLISFLVILTLHLAEWLMVRTKESFTRMLPGALFISCMVLYYFYNPAERMMWYYAMPEMFMVLQIMYSLYYFISTYIKSKMKWITVIAIMSIIACHTFADVYYGINWMNKTVRVIETERKKIGEMLGEMSRPDQTLLSGHGLISRHFKGYVLDASGLNSKVVSDYKRKTSALIKDFEPDYIIHHASPDVVNIYNQFNYQLVGIYRDISLGKNNSWILLQRHSLSYEIKFPPIGTSTLIFKSGAVDYWMPKQNKITILTNKEHYINDLHIGLERQNYEWTLDYIPYRNGTKWEKKTIVVPALNSDIKNPSSFIYDSNVRLLGCDSVVFTSEESGFRIIEPIIQSYK